MTRGVFVASNALPAAELNDVTDPPRCRVYNSANISLAVSGTEQALTFDTETEDTGGMHSTSVATNKITIPSGGQGWYSIGANCVFASNATGFRSIAIRVNGTTDIGVVRVPAVNGSSTAISIHIDYPLAASDYIEVYANQNSGGALNAAQVGVYGISFWATWQAVA